jgi:YVTN family beta-propeller protein
VGKRPRGIHTSPDGKNVYVALSGTPIEGPPQLDANGNPVFARAHEDKDSDDESDTADKSADGIGIVDTQKHKLIRKLSAGSDPEEFALSKDGRQIYASNEDVKTASVISISSGRVEHIIPIGQEPEGVTTTRDGRQFYVTCEAGGDIYVIDTTTYMPASHFKVHGRPRSVDFSPNGLTAFIPSESSGELNIVDTAKAEVSKTISLPPGSRPMGVRVSLDGSKLYLSTGRAGTILVIDTQSYAVIDTIKVGQRPWGIVLSPDGKYLFSANGPSNDISVVDLASNKEIRRITVGSSPWGLSIVEKR